MSFQIGGRIKVRHRSPEGDILWDENIPNGVTLQGRTHLLESAFNGNNSTASWYGGLISATGYSSLSENDTMSSHSGWNEFVSYSNSTRPSWTRGTASGGALNSSTPMSVTCNVTTSGIIQGAFITSNSTKSGTGGTLWATGSFGTARNAVSGGTFEFEYDLNTASS